MQQLLEAKNERARQPPSYPAPNAHTGQKDTGAPQPHVPGEPRSGEVTSTRPSPDALHAELGSHARGNQELRNKSDKNR
ncbi:hypothetical protein [Chiayiivirga flava]|uniref:Uncharacterized protein n=1 Tax=Chiayiivirga flava TaxID=659595 RepID=A0A7W8G024_9GAMM|nr:hypothetical protein [Chiayiivirga flava]MBB5208731.1 hypothetical protein [Chiayiivirga flava]